MQWESTSKQVEIHVGVPLNIRADSNDSILNVHARNLANDWFVSLLLPKHLHFSLFLRPFMFMSSRALSISLIV